MDIVRIRLRKPRRVLSFLCSDMVVRRDDPCIVESDQGLEWGVCMLPPEPCSPELAERITMRVTRKATDADMESFGRLEEEERRAMEICRRHIEKRALPMQLVDVEYTFDRHKVTFYFTAENRVDFRELVRDIARELHSRIELRHIQVRDRARLVGGLGCCGRVLCCNSWLDSFVPISMRMAKCQNLSLNPGKISGQCGRLLCCLNYENEAYEQGDVQSFGCAPKLPDELDEDQLAAFSDDADVRKPQKPIVVAAPVVAEEAPDGGEKRGDVNASRKRHKKRSGKSKHRKGKGNKGHGA